MEKPDFNPENKEKLRHYYLITVEVSDAFIPKIIYPIEEKSEEDASREIQNRINNEKGFNFIEKYKCKVNCEEVSWTRFKVAEEERIGREKRIKSGK